MFFPLAYIMGVSDASDSTRRIEETLRVAQLIATKTLMNEFVAYQQMSEMLRSGLLGVICFFTSLLLFILLYNIFHPLKFFLPKNFWFLALEDERLNGKSG